MNSQDFKFKKEKSAVENSWEKPLLNLLKQHSIKFLPYVPDAGHAGLISLSEQDKFIRPIVLTTEEEGIAFSSGSWLGGKKSVLLMQSSGVGNCINMLSMLVNCNFPFVTLITMRGEFGELNSWQIPMGQATPKCLETMGLVVHRVDKKKEVLPVVDASLYAAFSSDQQIAVLFSQKLVGRKEW